MDNAIGTIWIVGVILSSVGLLGACVAISNAWDRYRLRRELEP